MDMEAYLKHVESNLKAAYRELERDVLIDMADRNDYDMKLYGWIVDIICEKS